MIENKTTFTPLGTRVLLKMLPAENKSAIVLPDGVRGNAVQRFEVIAIGSMVNKDGYELSVGWIVQLGVHPGSIVGVDQEQSFLTVDRLDINVVVNQ
jgi:co-chaperonin GroES (HSP10)